VHQECASGTNNKLSNTSATVRQDKDTSEPADGTRPAYRVLARKYRPASFADLIGQEALIRTLTNAISSGRLAHAFMLTGVRGVGKTTTARILARALNCTGPDGTGQATAEPCGQCEHCLAIAEDRHVDVIEMDAASRTGIDDIRELIEGVRYRPVTARTKVYIIDEVHMLSRQAFNGLLKTLEEPPEHVVFIFATTEIRKVPVTVLSRCQRFDLRRVAQDRLAEHFAGLAEREGVRVAPPALAMIARAADGSVRDGLSLLDQAIALTGGEVGEEEVKVMLGLADRARIFDLFEAVMGGKIAAALDLLSDLYVAGADPVVVLQDLLELTHFLTRMRLVPQVAEDPGVPETERVRGQALAEKLGVAVLARTWQMLLKGLGEARTAPSPIQAAEMVLIRLAHASELPTPGELVRSLRGEPGTALNAAAPAGAGGGSGGATSRPRAVMSGPAGGSTGVVAGTAVLAAEAVAEAQVRAPAQAPQPEPEARDLVTLESFVEVVALARARKEGILANHLEGDLHLVRFEPGIIEFRPGERAPNDLAGRLGRCLQDWTGRRWMVGVSSASGAPSLREQRQARDAERLEEAAQDPLVQEVMTLFPGARIVEVREAAADQGGERDDPEPPTAKERQEDER
jgi:DNA polymerase-3 subunit gamma/tau